MVIRMSNKKRLKITHVASGKLACEKLVKDTTDALLRINTGIDVHSNDVTHVPLLNTYRCQMMIDKVECVTWYQCKQAIRAVKPVTFNLV